MDPKEILSRLRRSQIEEMEGRTGDYSTSRAQRDACRPSGRITFTRHAQARMRERELDADDIYQISRHGKASPGGGGKWFFDVDDEMHRRCRPSFAHRCKSILGVRVVIVNEGRQSHLVTVMRANEWARRPASR